MMRNRDNSERGNHVAVRNQSITKSEVASFKRGITIEGGRRVRASEW